ncbi:hypothetical protein WD019_21220 [Fictibacillus sp. Mic-4]|uniref:hypothetical protein n=1 Tax=Fictibacillus sp. Mic-4 TaxID=3132826 RepID=UPI003CF3F9B6
MRIESVINKQAQMSNIYDKLFQFTNTVLDYIEDGQIINSRLFLAHLQPLMSGGDIFYKKGTVFERIIGQYRNCSGITLYKKEKENDVEMLVLKGVTGAASDENKLYHLNDTTLFVVKTFNSKLDKELFFDASKQQLYFVINVKNYVICFHYPIDPYLSEDMIQRFKTDVLNAIIESESEMYRRMTMKLLDNEYKKMFKLFISPPLSQMPVNNMLKTKHSNLKRIHVLFLRRSRK